MISQQWEGVRQKCWAFFESSRRDLSISGAFTVKNKNFILQQTSFGAHASHFFDDNFKFYGSRMNRNLFSTITQSKILIKQKRCHITVMFTLILLIVHQTGIADQWSLEHMMIAICPQSVSDNDREPEGFLEPSETRKGYYWTFGPERVKIFSVVGTVLSSTWNPRLKFSVNSVKDVK